MALNLLHIY